MTDEVRIDVNSLIQNNNGNDRSLTSTGVGAQEKFIPITVLLEIVAKMLGVVVCGWVVLVFVQGGMVGTVERKDCGFVTMLFFLVCFRCWRHYCNQAPGSLTEADYSSIPNNNQQLALPIRYINRLLYCSRLVSAMTSVVLSVMRLASQDFGKEEVENKKFRDFALKVFYRLTLAEALVLLFAEALSFPTEALVLLFAEALSFPIRGNSVGLEDGPGDGHEVSPEDGPANQRICINSVNGVQVNVGRMMNGVLGRMMNGVQMNVGRMMNEVQRNVGRMMNGVQMNGVQRNVGRMMNEVQRNGVQRNVGRMMNGVQRNVGRMMNGVQMNGVQRNVGQMMNEVQRNGVQRNAGRMMNGVQMNVGRMVNGVQRNGGRMMNGVQMNGVQRNVGRMMNGVQMNVGRMVNGVQRNGGRMMNGVKRNGGRMMNGGLPANESNDFNSEGPADSLPNLRQRRREIPKSGDGDSPGRSIPFAQERRY